MTFPLPYDVESEPSVAAALFGGPLFVALVRSRKVAAL